MGVVGTNATFVVISSKDTELLEQAIATGVVDALPPVPKGLEILKKAEIRSCNCPSGAKDFRAFEEGKSHLE
jgi:hypothetical protein